MGSLFMRDSQEASSIEDLQLSDKASGDLNELSEEILDSLVNTRNPSSVGLINPPVLYSYVGQFPDLVKHSINTSKTNEIHKDLEEPSSNEVTLDAKKSEISHENDTAPRKKATINKKTRGSDIIGKELNTSKTNEIHKDLQESSSVEVSLDNKKSEISHENKIAPRKKATRNKKTYGSDIIDKDLNTSKTNEIHKDLQESSSDEATLDTKRSEISHKNDTAPRKKADSKKKTLGSDIIGKDLNTLKTNEIQKDLQESSSDEVTLDNKKSEISNENYTSPRRKATRNKKTRRSLSPRRVTRSALKFRDLSSPKLDIKDFFDSLSWYESNKSYFDKRLQLVLDDFGSSESSDTGSGKQYYDYLLLDSRVSGLTEWSGFIRAVFYVGKGKNKRAFDHIKEAEKIWMLDGKTTSKKISRILDIWRGEGAVIVLTAADGLVELEALTREALVIEALGKQRLCNKNYGSFYGVAAVMKAREKHELGATLLVKARERFIKDRAERIFAPVRLERELKKQENSEDEAFRVVLKQLERELKNRDYESAPSDKEVDNAVITALMTGTNSKVQKTKIN